jgi:hypothetical protein
MITSLLLWSSDDTAMKHRLEQLAIEGASRTRRVVLALLGVPLFFVVFSIVGDHSIAQPAASPPPPEAAYPIYIETGVAGVELMSSDSGGRFIELNGIGTTSDDGFLHNFYKNATGTEVVDLIQHPGSGRHSFAEVILFRPDWFPLGAPRIKDKSFSSSKGVKLGMGASELRRILGKPHKTKTEKSGEVTYTYHCEDAKKCPSLTRHNMPSYTAKAKFIHGRLVEYSFGYDYP